MLVLSSPSGAGKTSICKELLKKDRELKMSVFIQPDQKEKVKLTGKIIFL